MTTRHRNCMRESSSRSTPLVDHVCSHAWRAICVKPPSYFAPFSPPRYLCIPYFSLLITTLQSAKDHHLNPAFPCRMISCEVHSSLEAVGFMAAISKCLTERGISANPVSGFYHDHLFVPDGREAEAMVALEELAKEAARDRQVETPAH
ncbi:hypothetical protein XPA_009830 [Xanthoria parietina]